ncbi:MAG TPA: hypothetical protein DIU35_06740 [Candidatus Latescibacteria bacterium]|nr:hypothetical protein [Candidatus Latescibacterota bacterium]
MGFCRKERCLPITTTRSGNRVDGSTWSLLGIAKGGDLEEHRLTQIPAHNAFWFAWTTFWRNTGVS